MEETVSTSQPVLIANDDRVPPWSTRHRSRDRRCGAASPGLATPLWLLAAVAAACAPAVPADGSPPHGSVPAVSAGLRTSSPALAYDPARTAWVSFSDSESLS